MHGVRKAYDLADAALRRLEDLAAIVGAVLMLIAMVMTTLDALLRYIFNAPIVFSYHLTENYLMVGMLTMPLAWGFRTGGYIRINALALALRSRSRRFLLRSGLLVSAVYVAALAWYSAIHFIGVFQRGDFQMGVIDWPLWLSWVWVPIGVGLLAIRLFFLAFGPSDDPHFGVSISGEAP